MNDVIGLVVSVVLGLLVNEFCDVSPWLAVRLVRWSSRIRYRDEPRRLATRLPELESVVAEVPGKLSKLVKAVAFAGGALGFRVAASMRERKTRLTRYFGYPGATFVLFQTLGLYVAAPLVLDHDWEFEYLTPTILIAAYMFGCISARNKNLRRMLPFLISEKVISAKEAEFVLALYPLAWWHIGARRVVTGGTRWPAGRLKGLLLAVAEARSVYPARRLPSRAGYPVPRRRLDALLRETAKARKDLTAVIGT